MYEIIYYICIYYGEDLIRNSFGDRVYMNFDYFVRLFKKEMGMFFGNYVIYICFVVVRYLLEMII